MNKNEFLQRLKDDLSSLSDEERMSALKYYEEYFADAGENNEDEIITEFVSPENLANKIQDEIAANKKENMFNVFKEEPPAAPEPPKLVIVDNIDEIQFEIKKENQKEYKEESKEKNNTQEQNQPRLNLNNNGMAKMILLLCTFPIWLPVIAALGSAAFGIFMALFGISFAVAAMAVAGFIMVGAGFISIGYGVSNIFFNIFNAIYPIGAGFVVIGVGLIFAYFCTKLSALMFKSQFKFVGWTVRGITRIFSHKSV